MAETKRQQQKALTRKHLIEAAIKYLGQNGILTTRTSDISKAAGVSHGTVFAHFSTQEELISAVIEEFGDRISKKLHQSVEKSLSLRDVLKAHLTSLLEFEDFYTRLVIERRLLPKSACDTYILIQSTISFHIGIAAEREMEQGIIKKFPIHLLFNTWIGIIHYYLTNGDLFSAGGSVLKDHGYELMEHFMELIKK